MRTTTGAVIAGALTLAATLSACGSGPDRAHDPASSTSSGPTTPAPATPSGQGDPPQFRIVTTTSASPPADSLERQRLVHLDCSSSHTAAPGDPLGACDAAGVKYLLQPATFIGGVESAQALPPTASTGQVWSVDIRLDASSTKSLGAVTQRLTGTDQQLAVVVDGMVVFAPTVAAPVTGGELQVTGAHLTATSAQALAEALTD